MKILHTCLSSILALLISFMRALNLRGNSIENNMAYLTLLWELRDLNYVTDVDNGPV